MTNNRLNYGGIQHLTIGELFDYQYIEMFMDEADMHDLKDRMLINKIAAHIGAEADIFGTICPDCAKTATLLRECELFLYGEFHLPIQAIRDEYRDLPANEVSEPMILEILVRSSNEYTDDGADHLQFLSKVQESVIMHKFELERRDPR